MANPKSSIPSITPTPCNTPRTLTPVPASEPVQSNPELHPVQFVPQQQNLHLPPPSRISTSPLPLSPTPPPTMTSTSHKRSSTTPLPVSSSSRRPNPHDHLFTPFAGIGSQFPKLPCIHHGVTSRSDSPPSNAGADLNLPPEMLRVMNEQMGLMPLDRWLAEQSGSRLEKLALGCDASEAEGGKRRRKGDGRGGLGWRWRRM